MKGAISKKKAVARISSGTDSEKIKKIAFHVSAILEALGLSLDDPSLKDTPRRVAKMYVEEWFSGLDTKHFPRITTFPNAFGCAEPITVQAIRVLSTCEHHLATIEGQATVSYIPQKKIIGLSKLNRLVGYWSRRPQLQERLTHQITESVQNVLETQDVAVSLQARHFCVVGRGVQDFNSQTRTLVLRGAFEQEPWRSYFLKAMTEI